MNSEILEMYRECKEILKAAEQRTPENSLDRDVEAHAKKVVKVIVNDEQDVEAHAKKVVKVIVNDEQMKENIKKREMTPVKIDGRRKMTSSEREDRKKATADAIKNGEPVIIKG